LSTPRGRFAAAVLKNFCGIISKITVFRPVVSVLSQKNGLTGKRDGRGPHSGRKRGKPSRDPCGGIPKTGGRARKFCSVCPDELVFSWTNFVHAVPCSAILFSV
jgi:hypothetical protein